MKTNKATNPDAAIETWNAARAARDAASTAHQEAARAAERARSPGHGVDAETRLRVIALNVAALEAEDDEAAARARAVAALAARDVASGDPDALACDLARLHAETVAGIAEIERRRGELAVAFQDASLLPLFVPIGTSSVRVIFIVRSVYQCKCVVSQSIALAGCGIQTVNEDRSERLVGRLE